MTDEVSQEVKEEVVDKEPCQHKYWQWVWLKGIWTDERRCTNCGKVEKCGK